MNKYIITFFVVLAGLGGVRYYNQHHYTKAMEDSFMGGCVGEGATQTQCACMYRNLKEHYTASEASDMDRRVADGEAVPEINTIVVGCY